MILVFLYDFCYIIEWFTAPFGEISVDGFDSVRSIEVRDTSLQTHFTKSKFSSFSYNILHEARKARAASIFEIGKIVR